MKFKIGQKVRVISWYDMPEEIQVGYGINTIGIGNSGRIDKVVEKYHGLNVYNVVFEGDVLDKSGDALWNQRNLFESELEAIIEKGEQLMLFEL